MNGPDNAIKAHGAECIYTVGLKLRPPEEFSVHFKTAVTHNLKKINFPYN